MNTQKLIEQTDKYKAAIEDGLQMIKGDVKSTRIDTSLHVDEVAAGDFLRHLLFMCDRIKEFAVEGNDKSLSKAMRWLCFMQGCLYSNGYSTIDDFREDNDKILNT